MSNTSLFSPALSRTHSFVFFAVHENRGDFLVSGNQRLDYYNKFSYEKYTSIRLNSD